MRSCCNRRSHRPNSQAPTTSGDSKPDLERGELGVLAELACRDLVGGDAGAQIGTGGHLRVRSGQPRGAGARMVAAHFEIQPRSLLRIEPRHDHHAVLEVRERLENPGHLERALSLGRPFVLEVHDPVRDLDEAHTDRPRRFGRQGWSHGVEHWQCQYCACPAQKSPAGNVFFSDYHRLPSSFGTGRC